MDAAEDLGIAVVGLAGRWADAKDIAEFWQNVLAGHESAKPIPDEALLAAGGSRADLDDPGMVRMASVIDGIELFDANFFGYSPAEAKLLDPQQRLFLETCQHALEHAGYDPARFDGEVGVYGGSSQSEYFLSHVHPRYANEPGSLAMLAAKSANMIDAFATRVSFELNLTGPSLSVQTACSTSLVAVHLACQDLLNYRCDMALAGGAALNPSAHRGYRYVEHGVLSPDGRTRAFDAEARGTIRGDGVAAVVLRRLEDALADGDRIWAVIKGSAINNDGRRKPGFTTPSPDGQMAAVLGAHLAAEVRADTISYVEAHGTGTPVGDPIEVDALTRAFRESTDRTGFCSLGSVKPNVGHTDAAAGVTGLIKAILAVQHRTLPPTVGFRRPSPSIDFDSTPFRVHGEAMAWEPPQGGPLRAGVSSFGVGGTNAHVIIEEPPRQEAAPEDQSPAHLLRISARTPAQLATACSNLAAHLDTHPDLGLGDVAHTLDVGRRRFAYRRAVAARTVAQASELLRTAAGDPAVPASDGHRVAFLLPGGGAQYSTMGAELYRTQPVFRAEIDRASAALRPVLGYELTDELYGGLEPAEPAILASVVAVEYALARLLASHGVTPSALLGHSLGEYTAACLARVMSFEDALFLVNARDRLSHRIGGATVGVWLSKEELLPHLEGTEVDLATVNSRVSCTVSGSEVAVAGLERRLDAAGVTYTRIRLRAAPHSRHLDAVLPEFSKIVGRVTLNAPDIPFISNVTGTWITPEQATDPAYWVRHMRSTVQFADGLAELARSGNTSFAEVGPGRGLARHAQAHLGAQAHVVPMMRHAKDTRSDVTTLLDGLGQLWTAGAAVERPSDADRRRVPLPGYPFERTRHWIERVTPQNVVAGIAQETPVPFELDAEAGQIRAAESRWRDELPVDALPGEAVALIDRFCMLQGALYLQRAGVDTRAGREYELEEVHRLLGTTDRSRTFVAALLHMFVEDGLLRIRDGRLRFLGDPGGEDALEEVRATVRERFPDFARELELIDLCAGRYEPVVTGGESGAEALLADGRNDMTGAVLEKWVAAGDVAAYRALLVEQVARLARKIPSRKVRILEIGGGQGGVTWPLADALAGAADLEYRFTDVSGDFVLDARRRAEEEKRAGMSFDVLDISREPAEQGFPHGQWDIIVAFDVLHATADLRATLSHVNSLLAPGGALFLLEASSEPRIALLTSGLFKGWWHFDDDLREHSPLIGPESWREALTTAGFTSVASYPGAVEEEAYIGHALIVGSRRAHGDTGGTDQPAQPTASPTLNKRPALDNPYVAPRTELERDLVPHWQEVLGVEGISVEDNFFDLGGDSLLALQLVSRIRAATGRTFSVASVIEHPTVAALAAHSTADHGASTGGALGTVLKLRSGGSSTPLFCIHPAGGISWPYAKLLPAIDERFPVYGIQSRGLTDPGAMPRTIEDMAANYVTEIRAIQPSGPYALVGWSLGGLVAHAAAGQLERAGEKVGLLATLDAFPLTAHDVLRLPDAAEVDAFLMQVLLTDAGITAETDGPAPDLATVLGRLRGSDSVLSGVEEESLRRIADVMLHNTRILFDYTPGSISGDLLAFTATKSHDTSAPAPVTRWKPYVGGSVENRDLPCDHYSVLRGEALDIVGAELGVRLERLV
ncbi:type I polyketide synthase [Kitasatospora kifunensis]|uniref:Acyl transferase domain-containing protein/thioesterase domain-containing protein/SAM-dependent methyltransferase/aryl carrier-like protein n=1 Tax=Kitasatospora kifunensis TaxID=58351 RepID=A0A7W7VZX8_KITKI|nr:type I polyketide synthase [Kitasatospora kifunensis]MBB4928199.1 acyl transferase domain-containing protein/thioesterase domain-containing protein/SAM-dependent methyltransferase/aryl carrier-like protein [Kitasatospora kifunensis]